MPATSFNVLWLLCVLLLLGAFFLAIRKRRLAARTEADRNFNPTTYTRHTGQEVCIHMPTAPTNNNNDIIIQPLPPAFDPAEVPPPSYQDFRKDVRVRND